MELGFRILILSGIPDSKAQDFIFHMKNISGFRIPEAEIGIRIILHGSISSSLEVGLNTSRLRQTDTAEHPRGKEISLNYRRA